MDKYLISIIIAAKNGEKTIYKSLESIFKLEYSPFEVIVINDGSTDKTKEILKSFGDKVRIINTEGVGPSKARNAGVENSNGKFVAFTDADCIVDKNWLNELMRGFEMADERVAGVGGVQLCPEDDTTFGKMIADYMRSVGFVTEYIKKARVSDIIKTDHNPTCNVMYKKEMFDKVGKFLEGLWPGEDVEFDYRIKREGYSLFFNPAAIVCHYRPDSLNKFLKMMYRYGKAQGFLVRKYGFFRKIHFIPVVLCITAALVIILFKYIGLICIMFFAVHMLYFFLKTLSITRMIKCSLLNIASMIIWNTGFINGILNYRRALRD